MRARDRIALAALAVLTVAGVLLAPAAATAATGDVTEYPTPTLGSSPRGLAAGPDGAVWFVERNANLIGRITAFGVVTEYPLPTPGAWPTEIALGPDAALWFTEQAANAIGRIEPGGAVTEFPLPTPDSNPTGIALGPDGALWFTEQTGNRIGRIATDGTVTEFRVPTTSSWPQGIAAGPDGNLWFTEFRANRIGRITPGGQVTEFPLAGSRGPMGIAPGPDGNLWFTEATWNAIGRITTSGTLSEFPVPTPDSNPTGIAPGPDGAMWFTEQAGNQVGRIATDGQVDERPLPTLSSGPFGITTGPDGNVWLTQSAVSAVAKVELVPPDTEAPVVTLVSPGDGSAFLVGQAVTVDYTCTDGGGSGLASCIGTVADGDPLDTATPGVRHVTVAALDGAGNTASVTHDVVVLSSWDGRLALPPAVASLKAGQPADLRFDIGGDLGALLEPGAPWTLGVDCVTRAPLEPETSAVAVGQAFRFVGGRYTFRWRTERAWAGTCRQLVLPFAIGGGATVRLTVSFT